MASGLRVPHKQAAHMAAPTEGQNIKNALANGEPSTHGAKRTLGRPGSNDRFGPMCGRLPFGKGFLNVLSFGRCGHVCGLLMRHTEAAGHNAFR